jgi:hypothetical protein
MTGVEADAYCREIEAHLCRRNGGHLVRLVGPAFEMVAGWAAQGVPLKVALRGIDACVDRRTAKGPSRRPLRVEFCEADVLDGFDQWRRAVGVGTAGGGVAATAGDPALHGAQPESERRSKPGQSLRAHLDRVVTRLTDRAATGTLPASLEALIDSVIEELGRQRETSRGVRGEARATFIAHLGTLDARILGAAREVTPAATLAELEHAAADELRSFASRMPADAYRGAVAAAAEKLLREFWKLPDLRHEA